ncbi:MAG: dihydropteroate synthase [Legionella sp.]|nr:dihydropteroate synthase [Legionella sp.]
MGVLNVTPDSFSDGNEFFSVDKAVAKALHLIEDGADLIDVGGESTRPGASPVTLMEEIARVVPVIRALRTVSDTVISIDTYKPEVMAAAVAAGADMINDVQALQAPGAVELVANLKVPICLMHMKGTPQHMQQNPTYVQGVVAEVMDFFNERIQRCIDAGMAKEKIILDPGFGFGKQVHHNLTLIKQLARFSVFKLPILLGVSRKSTIGKILGREVNGRLIGSIVLGALAVINGANILRTHDVQETKEALTMLRMIQHANDI